MQNGDPVTIIIVSPSAESNYYLLVTVTATCSLIKDESSEPNIEFTIGLPLSWDAPINEDAMERLNDEDKLPLLLMVLLAEYSCIHMAYISCGDTIPNSWMFNGFSHILVQFSFLGDDFELFTTDDECVIFFGIYPIATNEFEFIQSIDSDSLISKLHENGVSLCFDQYRNSIIV